MKYRRLTVAGDKLKRELDIINLVRDIRTLELLKRVSLNGRQRLSVPHFRRYTIRNENITSKHELASYKSQI